MFKHKQIAVLFLSLPIKQLHDNEIMQYFKNKTIFADCTEWLITL